MNNTLYAIVPYFNYFNNKHRQINLLNFINKYKDALNLKIILVEGITQQELKLNHDINHVKYFVNQKIWIKENLINLALQKHLPSDWNYACWLDGDIEFLSNDWVNLTIKALDQFDIIQMFESVILDKGWKDKKLYGHAYSIKNSSFNNNFNHTGFAWAINNRLYSQIKSLWEFSLIGSGDNIIANCSSGSLKDIVNTYALAKYSKDYKKCAFEYEKLFKNCKLGYLPITIKTYYHGSKDKKQYSTRHILLNNFDISDFTKNKDGILEIINKTYLHNIEKYMESRETT